MKITYFGSGEFGLPCLNALRAAGYGVGLVFTGPPHKAGRGRQPRPTAVAQWAAHHNVQLIESDNINTNGIVSCLSAYKPDLAVVIAFGQKIGNPLIELPEKGMINVHASLLPNYRGAAPINWAIINGEQRTGVSIITVTERIDAGDILAQTATAILPDETAGELHDRLAGLAAPLLLETIRKIADAAATPTPQDDSKATRAPMLKKQDGFLDFAEPAEALRRKILGLWPWPGASAIYVSAKTTKCRRVVFAAADLVETSNPTSAHPGILDDNLNIICGRNALKITMIKPADGRLMDFDDFVRGRQTRPGDLFMKVQP